MGGCVVYQHVLAPQVTESLEQASQLLVKDFKRLRAYNRIYKSSYPLVMTESDSDLKQQFYPEGGRHEVTRNSVRCAIWITMMDQEIAVGNFDTCTYSIDPVEFQDDKTLIKMSTQTAVELVGHDPVNISLEKVFIVDEDSVQVQFHAHLDRMVENLQFFLVPELVTSAAPSDERHFKPCAWVGIVPSPQEKGVSVQMHNVVAIEEDSISYFDHEKELAGVERMDYLYRLDSADGDSYYNRISYQLAENHPMQRLEIRPAVSNYYQDYVYEEQSRLSYHTSGLMLRPWIPFDRGQASLEVQVTWELDAQGDPGIYEEVLPLIEGCIG